MESAILVGLDLGLVDWLPVSRTNLLHDEEEAHTTRRSQSCHRLHNQFLNVALLLLLTSNLDNAIFTGTSFVILQGSSQSLVSLSHNLVKSELDTTNKIMRLKLLKVIEVIDVIDINLVVFAHLKVVLHIERLNPLR